MKTTCFNITVILLFKKKGFLALNYEKLILYDNLKYKISWRYEKHTLLQIAKSMRNIITEDHYQQLIETI